MNRHVDRRHLLQGSVAGAAALASLAGFSAPTPSRAAGLFGGSDDSFDALVAASKGAVAATFSDFAVQSPEGNTCTARLAYPLVLNKKLPVLVFCPDESTSASHYDTVTGALAAQDYFVLTIDRRSAGAIGLRSFQTSDQHNEARLRRFAEARFLLDTIDAAAAALGPRADLVDTSRVGAMGHGEGAWIAAGLGGWDSNGSPSTRTRDGRVYAVIGLLPARTISPNAVPAQRSPDGVSGMFIGNLAQMPVPARGSGLLGLGLPYRSNTFGGLIGNPAAPESRRATAEHDALAAAIAASTLFLNWVLKGEDDDKKVLMALDGHRVTGLTTPLQLRKA
jgi:hypothetical protein